jgi:hypothetical protein
MVLFLRPGVGWRSNRKESGKLRLKAGLPSGYKERLPQHAFQETFLLQLKHGRPGKFNKPPHIPKVVILLH